MHLPFDFICELWHLLDVNAVAGHDVVLLFSKLYLVVRLGY